MDVPVILLLALAGCGGPGPGMAVAPVDAGRTARAVEKSTMPEKPLQIRFGWRLAETDLRLDGEGVARLAPPYRIRVDLFAPRGETVFQAALVEGDLRIPFWAPRELAPPPALLWAALGVFRPDPDLELLGGRRRDDGGTDLRYGGASGPELRFRVLGGKLRRAGLYRNGHLEEEVELSYQGSSGELSETVYRNRAEFRELRFEIETVENVDAFPLDIWYPGN